MDGHSLKVIAQAVQGELQGDPELIISGVRPIEEAGEAEISVVIDRRVASSLSGARAAALIVPVGTDSPRRNLIRVKSPRQALIRLLQLFHPEPRRASGVDTRAVVSSAARLGPDVSIAAGSYVEADAIIGARVQIYPNVYVGQGVQVGDDCVLFPNVTLYPGARIGKRVRIHSGTVISGDGFGYDRDESGVYRKIPHVGYVEVGDDVEIGANCAIDRATLGATRIGAGTKIDNLVQVGHSSEIGQNCCVISQVGLAGSVRVGDSCVLAGQSGIADHIKLDAGVVVGAKAGVMRDLTAGEWIGSPAMPAQKAFKVFALIERLPEYRNEVRELKKRCAKLEELVAQLQQGRGQGSEVRGQ